MNSSKICCLYTDGSCLGNPGPGGWAALLLCNKELSIKKGGECHTTNNRMELSAVIHGLSMVDSKTSLKIIVDSRYVYDGITCYVKKRKKSGRKTSNNNPVANKELRIDLDTAVQKFKSVCREHTYAHKDDTYNNQVDSIARKQAIWYKKND